MWSDQLIKKKKHFVCIAGDVSVWVHGQDDLTVEALFYFCLHLCTPLYVICSVYLCVSVNKKSPLTISLSVTLLALVVGKTTI